MPVICHTALPLRPWSEPRTARLPGLNPVDPGDWLRVDEVYAAQMAYREELLATRRAAVHALDDSARPAAQALLDAVLAEIEAKPGFSRSGDAIDCPDGRRVVLDRDDPLVTAGRLVQEDLVLMQQPEGAPEHVLTGTVLCFPASWTLAEKVHRPLTAIHVPVPVYDADLARRVQRLFDGLRPGRPIWRANALVYADPDLHHPRREGEHRVLPKDGARWLRIERQVLNRLDVPGSVVFSIHTYILPFERLSPEDRAALDGQTPVR
jgi:Haem-dependent oxidative N-demethylase, alpha subunit-like